MSWELVTGMAISTKLEARVQHTGSLVTKMLNRSYSRMLAPGSGPKQDKQRYILLPARKKQNFALSLCLSLAPPLFLRYLNVKPLFGLFMKRFFI